MRTYRVVPGEQWRQRVQRELRRYEQQQQEQQQHCPCRGRTWRRRENGWVDAFIDCIRGKRGSHDCENYLIGNFELDLWMLIYEVETKSYTPGKSKCFVVTRPRPREIFAAFFRDRIVQHWAANKLEPMFEERFMRLGDVSFNCRKGHGTWDAIERLQYTPCSGDWIGKYDLQNFFMSIDKRLLLRKVSAFVYLHYVGSDKEVLMWLLEVIIMHCPQENCEVRGDFPTTGAAEREIAVQLRQVARNADR
jgi:RNA-directed DNA polymerase